VLGLEVVIVVEVVLGNVAVMLEVDVVVWIVVVLVVALAQDVKSIEITRKQLNIIQIIPLFICSSLLFNGNLLGN
jgi:hypothetical protein